MKVEVKNLSMSFDDAGRRIELFRDLNLEVLSGSSLAVVGQSGVGKTTLLYLLGALEKPKGGDIFIDGIPYSKYREQDKDMSFFRGRSVGFIFQFHHLLSEFDAVENVAMPLIIQGVSLREASDRARALLNRVGLGERLTHRPGMLSGGEQQRVAIARALVANPGLILADEPTGNLDQITGESIKSLLLELQAEKKLTLIVVTHSHSLASCMERVVELTPAGIFDRNFSSGVQV